MSDRRGDQLAIGTSMLRNEQSAVKADATPQHHTPARGLRLQLDFDISTTRTWCPASAGLRYFDDAHVASGFSGLRYFDHARAASGFSRTSYLRHVASGFSRTAIFRPRARGVRLQPDFDISTTRTWRPASAGLRDFDDVHVASGFSRTSIFRRRACSWFRRTTAAIFDIYRTTRM